MEDENKKGQKIHHNQIQIQDEYVIVFYLQTEPKRQRQILNQLHSTTQYMIDNVNGGIIHDYHFFRAYGKHDIICFFYSNNVLKTLNFVYELIDKINTSVHCSGILDVAKTVGFRWRKKSEIIEELPVLCYTLIKIEPKDDENDTCTPVEIEYNIVESLKQEIGKYIDTDVDIYGTFSWNEISCLFFGKKYEDILEILYQVRMNNPIYSTSSIVLIDERNITDSTFSKNGIKDQHKVSLIEDSLNFATLIPVNSDYISKCRNSQKDLLNYYTPSQNSDILGNIDTQNLQISEAFGCFDFFLWNKGKLPLKDIDEIVDNLRKNPNIYSTTTTISLIIDEPNFNGNKIPNLNQSYIEGISNSENKNDEYQDISVDEPHQELEINQELYSIIKPVLIGDIEVPRLRMKSIRNSIKALGLLERVQNTMIYDCILPERLVTFVNSVITEESIKDVGWLITELQNIVSQRLAGIELGVLLGLSGGMLEQSGGYQRIILSAETIPLRAWKVYMKSYQNRTPEKLPMVLCRFDSRHYETLERIDIEDFPIILRFPTIKYCPWLWVHGLHELAHHLPTNKKAECHKKYIKSQVDDIRQLLSIFPAIEKISVEVIRDVIILFISEYADLEKLPVQIIENIISRYPEIKENDISEVSPKVLKELFSNPDSILLDIIEFPQDNFKMVISEYLKVDEELLEEIKADDIAAQFVGKELYIKSLRKLLKGENKKHSREIFMRKNESEYISKTRINNYINNELKNGIVIIHFPDDLAFFSYVCAFLSLPPDEQQRPSIMTSFILSLYNERHKLMISNNQMR